jgi:predicted MFS family arabinose efflux permease
LPAAGAPAPARGRADPFNWHIIHASIELVSATLHIRRLFLAILSISFFWTIGAVLIIIFPPLVKNVLGADEQVASLFIAIFSIGIAIGSVLINRLLKSEVPRASPQHP